MKCAVVLMLNKLLFPRLGKAKIAILLPILLVLSNTVPAQEIPALSLTDIELTHYLESKYSSIEVTIEIENHYLYGPRRILYIHGEFNPPAIAALGAAVLNSDPRTIAQAFLTEEAALFGIIPGSELRAVISKNAEIAEATDERKYTNPLVPPLYKWPAYYPHGNYCRYSTWWQNHSRACLDSANLRGNADRPCQDHSHKTANPENRRN